MIRGSRLALAAAAIAAGVLVALPELPLGAETVSEPGESAAIVVELFTSQGCSSCPPADRYLSELAHRSDVEVIALSFHVDYWDYIGWTDPFSSEEWSDRQRRYGRAFGTNRIYTPQMVVNGRWEGVGSDRREISGLLERARAEPQKVEIELFAEEASGSIRVAVDVQAKGAALARRRLGVWVAVVESGLVTPVGRGENASKTLRNDCVVRLLERAPLDSGGVLEVPLRADWRREQLRIVSFAQDEGSLRVLGAASRALGS